MTPSPPTVSQADSFQYPYAKQHDISPLYDDVFKRPVRRLVASFALFGKKVMKRKSLAQNLDINSIESIVRMCDDSMQTVDFDVLISRAQPLERSKIIRRGSDLNESLQDSKSCEQVIVPHSISQDKWLIYLVALRSGAIDVYVIGDILSHEMEPFHVKLQEAVTKVFPNTSFSFKLRLHLRSSLRKDPVLTAYLFTRYLHSNGKYLDLNLQKINLLKFEVFEPL